MTHLLRCPSCGVLGRKRRARTRAARAVADEMLVHFHRRLARTARTERRERAMARVAASIVASHTPIPKESTR